MADYAALLGMGSPAAAALVDSNGRRRPSLQQGTATSKSASNGSKSRNRSSSATAAGATNYARAPPMLNSSASMATIASTSSTSSSYKGSLSRRDSYTDMVARGFPQPPTGLGVTREGQVRESPIAPVFEPGRSVSSRKIMSDEEMREEDDRFGAVDALEYRAEDGQASKAAAEVGMRRMPGITRKISDSRRIIRPPSPGSREDEGGGAIALAEELEQRVALARDQLGIPAGSVAGSKRESSMSAAASTVQGYTSSSDEASTSSSLKSARSRSSISGTSGLPQTSSFSHSKRRGSKTQMVPAPLDLQSWADKGGSTSSTSANSTSERPPSSRPQTVPPARSATASPLKYASLSVRNKQSGGLEVPNPVTTPGSPGSRLSSLASPSGSITGQKTRSISTTTLNSMIARSDSTSSAATAPSYTLKNPPASTTTPVNTSRSQKSLSSRDRKESSKVSLAAYAASAKNRSRHPPSLEPPLPDPSTSPSVAPAPASGMYWYKAPTHGQDSMPLRAHTCTLVGSNIYVFGGCDVRTCFNELHVFDADSMSWSKPAVCGEIPPPLRAMTTTAVNKKLVIFGGGDGPTYYNDIYVFDTVTNRYTKPKLAGGQQPSRRRAHTACLHKNGIYVFGGGDGVRALNDVWRLDVSDLTKPSWKLISAPPRPGGSTTSLSIDGRPSTRTESLQNQARPTARGYHTANMVGSKLIVFGGSDGDECFRDVWVFDLETNIWKCVGIKTSYPRLSHTATIVGSYLFVVGGHDGVEYSSEVLLLNLVTMQWDKRKVYGMPPSGRGYHGAVLHDSRLFVIGGFDGHDVFNDTYILELAVSSYYSQISHFTIEV
ncbi:galactose oxidase [Choiromyces venosus 120613-1]|uniref:Galactose oxidase n=1 Tax=Choiromyces venosus 120613-1 TaxID=1336337 RepID=A0A3N4K9L7_9PEZI|nr:galactose oxidase [Choiromyces venosus 120613-1]